MIHQLLVFLREARNKKLLKLSVKAKFSKVFHTAYAITPEYLQRNMNNKQNETDNFVGPVSKTENL